MTDGHNFGARDRLDMPHESGRIVDPLRPRVDVAPLAWALAVASEIERVGADAVLCHPGGESFVTAGVLAETVHDGECNSPRLGPGSIGELRTVRRLDRADFRQRALSRQGDRDLSES